MSILTAASDMMAHPTLDEQEYDFPDLEDAQSICGSNIDASKLRTLLRIKFGGAYNMHVSDNLPSQPRLRGPGLMQRIPDYAKLLLHHRTEKTLHCM